MIAILSSFSAASGLCAASVTITVVIGPMSWQFSASLVLAVVSIFTLVPRLLASCHGTSCVLASCSVSKEITDGFDQVLDGIAL